MLLREVFIIMPMMVSLFWVILLLVNPRKNITKRYLAFFMFISTINYFVHSLYFSREYELFALWDNIWILTSLSSYPLYYNYIRLLTKEETLGLKRFRTLTPAILLSLFSFVLYYMMSPQEMEIYLYEIMYHEWELSSGLTPILKLQQLKLLLFKVIFVLQVFYTFFCGSKLIIEYNNCVSQFYSKTEGRNLSAIKWVLYVFVFASVISLVSSIIGKDYFIEEGWMIAIPSITHSLFLFAIGYVGYNQNFTISDFNKDLALSNVIDAEANKNELEQDEIKHGVLTHLDEIMIKKELFRNSDIRISDLVKILGTNRTYVSKLINEEKGMNFCEWINGYRVEYAKRLLEDPENDELTMIAIAEMSGFSSRSVFYRAFKNREGVTPGHYREQLNL